MANQSSANKAANKSGDAVTVDDLREDFTTLRADMATLVEQITEMSKSKVSETAKSARQAATEAKDGVAGQAKQGYAAGHGWLSEQAATRPLLTIGIAVMAGVVIGRSMRK